MAKDKRRFQKERPPAPDSIETPWRLFIAVPMPEAVTALIDGLVRDFSAGDWPVRWTAPDTAHLTLHFIGETEPERAELLRLALRAVVARHAPFELQTGGLGVFPNPRLPRVIWLGLHGQTQRLEALHRDLARTLRQLDQEVEHRSLQPHITLGRVRDNPPADFPPKVERCLANEALQRRVAQATVAFPVGEMLLLRSYLGKAGARHEPVARYPLVDRPLVLCLA